MTHSTSHFSSASHSSINTFVVSAPSGAGKTTLNKRLTSDLTDIELSVSYTTRAKRPAEVEGRHYHFIDRPRFEEMISSGRMLEHAEVFGTLYGTSYDEVERISADGKKVLLEIDVQGWQAVRHKLPGCHSIFILPPSIDTLWRRLSKRGTETTAARLGRLQAALQEISAAHLYDFFIVNDNFEEAYSELRSVVLTGRSHRLSKDQGIARCHELATEFRQGDWSSKSDESCTTQLPPRAHL